MMKCCSLPQHFHPLITLWWVYLWDRCGLIPSQETKGWRPGTPARASIVLFLWHNSFILASDPVLSKGLLEGHMDLLTQLCSNSRAHRDINSGWWDSNLWYNELRQCRTQDWIKIPLCLQTPRNKQTKATLTLLPTMATVFLIPHRPLDWQASWFCVSQINPRRSEKAKEFLFRSSFWVWQKTQAFAPCFCWTNSKVWLAGNPNSSVKSRFIKESWLGRSEISAPSYTENNSPQTLITCLLKAHCRTTDNL